MVMHVDPHLLFSDPYFAQVLAGIGDQLAGQRAGMMLWLGSRTKAETLDHVLRMSFLDGVIVSASTSRTPLSMGCSRRRSRRSCSGIAALTRARATWSGRSNQLARRDGAWVLTEPKTAAGHRTIDLGHAPDALRALRDHQRRMAQERRRAGATTASCS